MPSITRPVSYVPLKSEDELSKSAAELLRELTKVVKTIREEYDANRKKATR